MARLESCKHPSANARLLVVLLSRAFYESQSCLDEYATALTNGVQVLAVNLEPRTRCRHSLLLPVVGVGG